MHPPLKNGASDLGAPVTEWHQVSAYDTAKECEDGLVSLVRQMKDDFARNHLLDAKCVPADHVYPPKPAAK